MTKLLWPQRVPPRWGLSLRRGSRGAGAARSEFSVGDLTRTSTLSKRPDGVIQRQNGNGPGALAEAHGALLRFTLPDDGHDWNARFVCGNDPSRQGVGAGEQDASDAFSFERIKNLKRASGVITRDRSDRDLVGR